MSGKILRSGLVFLPVSVVEILLDYLSKLWIINNVPAYDPNGFIEVIHDFFSIIHVHNQGAAFSFLADKGGWQKDDYYVFAATGTKDIAYENMVPLMRELRNDTKRFTYTSDFSQGNLYFLEAPNETHWWGIVRHYVYDALPYFFHEGK